LETKGSIQAVKTFEIEFVYLFLVASAQTNEQTLTLLQNTNKV